MQTVSEAFNTSRSATKFQVQWNFLNAISCIDVKYVETTCPPKTRTIYLNYKQHISTVLQGVADSECRSILIDINACSMQSGSTFSASTFFTSRKTMNLPYPSLQVLKEVQQKFRLFSRVMMLIL